ncbi:MAG: hypothetical protein R3C49_27650 [Planctomycetaceae bacterium]
MADSISTTRSSRDRRAVALMGWGGLVLTAITLWNARQTGSLRSATAEPVAFILAAFAAFVGVFAWMLFNPARRSTVQSPALFLAAIATLFPPPIIGFCLMPVDSPLRGWLAVGLFLLVAIAVLSQVPDEFFAVPRARRSYLTPLPAFDRVEDAVLDPEASWFRFEDLSRLIPDTERPSLAPRSYLQREQTKPTATSRTEARSSSTVDDILGSSFDLGLLEDSFSESEFEATADRNRSSSRPVRRPVEPISETERSAARNIPRTAGSVSGHVPGTTGYQPWNPEPRRLTELRQLRNEVRRQTMASDHRLSPPPAIRIESTSSRRPSLPLTGTDRPVDVRRPVPRPPVSQTRPARSVTPQSSESIAERTSGTVERIPQTERNTGSGRAPSRYETQRSIADVRNQGEIRPEVVSPTVDINPAPRKPGTGAFQPSGLSVAAAASAIAAATAHLTDTTSSVPSDRTSSPVRQDGSSYRRKDVPVAEALPTPVSPAIRIPSSTDANRAVQSQSYVGSPTADLNSRTSVPQRPTSPLVAPSTPVARQTAPPVPSAATSAPVAQSGTAQTASPRDASQIQRTREPDGSELIEGVMKVHFDKGQKRANIHVPFSPPLAGLPEVECECVGNEDLRLKVPVRQSYGIRIEARRTQTDQPLDAEIGFAAVYTA